MANTSIKPPKTKFKARLLEELRAAFREVNQIERGKSKGIKAEDFLRKLK